LKRNPDARILACAPSNSAADIIAERLINIGRLALFRLYAPSRPPAKLPVALEVFSRRDPRGFVIPPCEELAKFNVIVATCVSATIPRGIGLPADHFNYIFVDEAGQAREPEIMIPIKINAGPKTNIILSGDPEQLGPIIRSPVARQLGFEQSYLDRLMAMELYHEQGLYRGVS
jgi:helicase MOV-10